MDLDAGDEATDVADEPREREELPPPEPMREAMDQHRVEARVRERDLDHRASRRIALEDRADVLAEPLPGSRRFLESRFRVCVAVVVHPASCLRLFRRAPSSRFRRSL